MIDGRVLADVVKIVVLAASTDALLRVDGTLELGHVGLRIDSAQKDALTSLSRLQACDSRRTLNGAMPELMKSSVGSSYGITDAEGTTVCSCLSRKYWRSSQSKRFVHPPTDLQERLAHALGRPVAELTRRRARCHCAHAPIRSLEQRRSQNADRTAHAQIRRRRVDRRTKFE